MIRLSYMFCLFSVVVLCGCVQHTQPGIGEGVDLPSAQTISPPSGTFAQLGDWLKAHHAIQISTLDESIRATPLSFILPPDRPFSAGELFENIALQTQSSWLWKPNEKLCIFTPADAPVPFEFAPAKDWTTNRRGASLSCKHERVTLDINFLARFTPADDSSRDAHLRDFYSSLYIQSLAPLHPKLRSAQVDGVPASRIDGQLLPAGSNNALLWRQWIFIDQGYAYSIVVSYSQDESEQITPAVLSMLDSFHIQPLSMMQSNPPASRP